MSKQPDPLTQITSAKYESGGYLVGWVFSDEEAGKAMLTAVAELLVRLTETEKWAQKRNDREQKSVR